MTIPAGTTLSVTFKLDLSDAMIHLPLSIAPIVYLSENPATDSSSILSGTNSTIIYDVVSKTTAGKTYSLSVTTLSEYTGQLYLCLQGPSLQDTGVMNYEEDFANYSFGKIWQAVSFYDASGFFFQNGSGGVLRDQWNGYFSVTHALPDMKTSWSNASGWSSTNGNVSSIVFTLARNTDLKNLETNQQLRHGGPGGSEKQLSHGPA